MIRRALAACALACVALVIGAAPASAHASLERSSPSDGQILETAPGRIELTFTEPPDPGLTAIGVVTSSGTRVATGPVEVGTNDRTIDVALRGSLPDGVYTVTWRTVSKTDGHLTSNAFTFGVGVTQEQVSKAGGGASAEAESPTPSALSVAGKWGLYAGLSVLLGAGLGGVLVFGTARASRRGVLILAWAVAALGVVAVILAERSSIGTSLGTLLSSEAGSAFVRLAVGVVVVGLAVAAVAVRPSRGTLLVLAAAVAGEMLIRAQGGHAAGSLLEVGSQWVHLLGAGVWIGGLVWLVLSLRGDVDGTTVRRYSNLAAVGLALIAVTGVVRATNELGGLTWWLHPLRNGYSTTLALKVLAFAPLLALGAANRFRNVPSFERRGRGPLLRSVGGELAIAAVVFGLTGVMTGLPPEPLASAQPARPQPLVVSGSDFATTTKVRLSMSPGVVGANSFVADVTDYDTGARVDATAVSLTFDLPDQPEVSSTLPLERGRAGQWQAGGTNLSMNGTWNVSVLVETATGSVEVPLTVTPRPPQQTVSVQRIAGQPTLYTITVQDGLQIQAYVDPGEPGRTNALHVTAFDAAGEELPLRSATISLAPPEGRGTTPDLLRFGPGHFVANFDLTPGRWSFAVTAQARGGQTLIASFAEAFGS